MSPQKKNHRHGASGIIVAMVAQGWGRALPTNLTPALLLLPDFPPHSLK
jgi:hypothetical protein